VLDANFSGEMKDIKPCPGFATWGEGDVKGVLDVGTEEGFGHYLKAADQRSVISVAVASDERPQCGGIKALQVRVIPRPRRRPCDLALEPAAYEMLDYV
jgi:hypothetical protein